MASISWDKAAAILTLAGVVAFIGCEPPVYRQQAAAASRAVQAMGGAGQRFILTSTDEGPRYRVELNFRGRTIGDRDLAHLEDLDMIVGLDLSETAITDDGLRRLANVPNLEYLQIADTSASDEGLRALRSLPNLRQLDIRRTAATQEAASVLVEFPSLETVYAKGTGLISVKGLSVDVENELEPFWKVTDEQ